MPSCACTRLRNRRPRVSCRCWRTPRRRRSGRAQFDLVLTPWFIDVAGEPVAQVARRVNALLAPGGFWVNHGSLAFADAAPAQAWSLEELVESLPSAGFARAEPRESRQPYLASPASRHARIESVITFCARKERDVPAPPAGRELPPWIRQPDLPVPVLPQFRAQALSTRVYAFLLAMIDGERTIRDMARLMETAEAHAGGGRVAGDSPLPGARLRGAGPASAVLWRAPTCRDCRAAIIVAPADGKLP